MGAVTPQMVLQMAQGYGAMYGIVHPDEAKRQRMYPPFPPLIAGAAAAKQLSSQMMLHGTAQELHRENVRRRNYLNELQSLRVQAPNKRNDSDSYRRKQQNAPVAPSTIPSVQKLHHTMGVCSCPSGIQCPFAIRQQGEALAAAASAGQVSVIQAPDGRGSPEGVETEGTKPVSAT